MNGRVRSMKYWLMKFGFSLLMVMGIGLLMYVLSAAVSDGEDIEISYRSFLNYLSTIGVLIISCGHVSAAQCWMSHALSMGAGRSDTFWGIQVMSLCMGVMGCLLTVGGRLLGQSLFGVSGYYTVTIQVVMVLINAVLLSGIFGEFLFVMMSKFGKVGFYLFVILCGVVGMIYGVSLSMSHDGGIKFISLPGTLPLFIAAVEIVVYIIGAVIQYRYIKMYEVRA